MQLKTKTTILITNLLETGAAFGETGLGEDGYIPVSIAGRYDLRLGDLLGCTVVDNFQNRQQSCPHLVIYIDEDAPETELIDDDIEVVDNEQPATQTVTATPFAARVRDATCTTLVDCPRSEVDEMILVFLEDGPATYPQIFWGVTGIEKFSTSDMSEAVRKAYDLINSRVNSAYNAGMLVRAKYTQKNPKTNGESCKVVWALDRCDVDPTLSTD